MSVHLSERISAALEGPLSAKVDVGEFYDNMARNNWTKTSVVLHEQLRSFIVAGNASSPLRHRCAATPSMSLFPPVT